MAGLVITNVINSANEIVGVNVVTNEYQHIFNNTAKCFISKKAVKKICIKDTDNEMLEIMYIDGSKDQISLEAVDSFNLVTPVSIDSLYNDFIAIFT